MLYFMSSYKKITENMEQTKTHSYATLFNLTDPHQL